MMDIAPSLESSDVKEALSSHGGPPCYRVKAAAGFLTVSRNPSTKRDPVRKLLIDLDPVRPVIYLTVQILIINKGIFFENEFHSPPAAHFITFIP